MVEHANDSHEDTKGTTLLELPQHKDAGTQGRSGTWSPRRDPDPTRKGMEGGLNTEH